MKIQNIMKNNKEVVIGSVLCVILSTNTLMINSMQQTITELQERQNHLKNNIDGYQKNIFKLEGLVESFENYDKKLENKICELEEKLNKYTEEQKTETCNVATTKNLNIKQSFNMEATAYYTGEPGVGTTTASGTTATLGRTVAVDRRLIPLGSKLYIEFPNSPEFNGYYVAEDVGGAIKGNIIDLYVDGERTADKFGRQPIILHVLNKGDANNE